MAEKSQKSEKSSVRRVAKNTSTKESLQLGRWELFIIDKLPAARPLLHVTGFDEFSDQWYLCCGIHIAVLMAITIPFNCFYAMTFTAIGFLLGFNYDNVTMTSFLLEICATFAASLFCLINFFVLNRYLSLAFVIAQTISALVVLISSIIMTVYHHANSITGNGAATDSTISTQPSSTDTFNFTAGSRLTVVILSYVLLVFQAVTVVVALRFRLYLLIKTSCMKLNVSDS